MKRSIAMWIVAVFLLFSFAGVVGAGSGADKLYWGEAGQGTYQSLHPYTLNWTGDVLDKGGFILADMKTTTDPKKADFVINKYGAIGASAILKLDGERLGDPTVRDQSGFQNSYTMAQGDVYLVVLSSGKYAKLQIDRILPSQVSFSYVLETAAPVESAASQPTPAKPTPAKPTPAKPTPAKPTPDQQQQQTQTPAAKRTEIKLTIDDNRAFVSGEGSLLYVPPTVVNGTTLVPLRFLADSLGADLKWDGNERKITLNQNGKTIMLWIDKTYAYMNGRTIQLEAAPAIIKDTTVVPLRFISEAFDQDVQFDPDTRKIAITSKTADAVQPSNTPQPEQKQSATASTSMTGNYNISPRGAWMPGLGNGSLSIFPDGTYMIKIKEKGEYFGVWYTAKSNEVENYPKAIILMNAMEKSDWALVGTGNGKIVLLERHAWSNNALYNPKITVTWNPGYDGEKASDDPDQIEQFKAKDYDFDAFVGSYSLWIEGGATNLYDTNTGDYVTHEYNPGADGGTLTIYADGTYTMETSESKSGKWRPSKINEVFGYEYSIILENGPDGIDWTLLVNGNGKTMLSYEAGKWADRSTMWLPYYIASRTDSD